MKVNIGKPKKKGQKVKVHIDPWDTWSLDYTLAPILLAALKQLKETKMGASKVDNEDVPPRLQTHPFPGLNDLDDNWFARWDYVPDEMIFANEWLAEIEDDMLTDHSGMYEYDNYRNLRAMEERAQEGFRLMGKYFQSLWT